MASGPLLGFKDSPLIVSKGFEIILQLFGIRFLIGACWFPNAGAQESVVSALLFIFDGVMTG